MDRQYFPIDRQSKQWTDNISQLTDNLNNGQTIFHN